MSNPALKLTRSTVGRVVHLNFKPRPINLGQSSEIYRTLSQFGEVEYFKNLRYGWIPNPNSAIVIFKDAAAAARCVEAAGMVLEIDKAPSADRRTTRQPASTDTDTPRATDPSASSPGIGAPLEEGKRAFEIHANLARVDWAAQTELGCFYGNFEPNFYSPLNYDLRAKVPMQGMACMDWRQDRRPGRDLRAEKEKDERGSLRWVPLREVYNNRHLEERSAEEKKSMDTWTPF